jgi:hypothetical protein
MTRAKVLSYLPIVLAIIIGVGYPIYDIILQQGQFTSSANITLLAIGTLALSQISDRISIFDKVIKHLESNDDTVTLIRSRGFDELTAVLKQADIVKISAGSLTSLVTLYGAPDALFEQMAEESKELKFILMDPDNSAINQVAQWANQDDNFKNRIELSLDALARLADEYPKVNLRVNPTIPALAYVATISANG